MTDIHVVHDPDRLRYRASIGGEAAGFAEYLLTDELIVFTHTDVERRFEGKGVGSALARFAGRRPRSRPTQGHAAVSVHQGLDRTAS
ncbi:GNAT family N-acetyltransferase [Nocardioides sp. cx-173]|uniref:GNAT family N-acetyltransferase n=1 Tax=Nocardioides sp. cx-173 TaxID=2898796 RepID=UPI001E646425|nr:N-acetyltransferase [Nocardioides sp. cx-173]MCD4525022.1 N-acetyltransferase [Nocardioides sp. cx-173]UGB40270.1 N-acetyltransferase [Nocardioides sp. cx-173]